MTIYPAPHDRAKAFAAGILAFVIVAAAVAAALLGWIS